MTMKETRAMAKGIAKKTATTLKGQTGIYATLAKEHGMVSSLMNQVLQGDLDTRRELFPKIKLEILSHAHAEEEEFYSVLLHHEPTRLKAQHALEDHKAIEERLLHLGTIEMGSVAWLEAFKEMRDLVENHAKEEEKELFPLAKKALDNNQASAIDKRFAREKSRQRSNLSAAE